MKLYEIKTTRRTYYTEGYANVGAVEKDQRNNKRLIGKLVSVKQVYRYQAGLRLRNHERKTK